jgi:hypothetical protein
MVDIGIVRMPVHESRMAVPVHMRLFLVPLRPMLVPVVCVVNVLMLVFQRLVRVLVLVMLGDVQPYAGRHEGGGRPE